MASESHLYDVPLNGITYYGCRPWERQSEGLPPLPDPRQPFPATPKSKKAKKAKPRKERISSTDCPMCGGWMLLPKGETVHDRDGSPSTLDSPMAVRRATLAEAYTFFLEDGRVVRPAGDDDVIFDSELVVVACARCHRVPERYESKLRGRLTQVATGDTWKRPGKMAPRVVGTPDPKLNSYLNAKTVAPEGKPNKSRKRRKGAAH